VRKIEISTASKPLAQYANELGDEIVILTSGDKPVAAIVSLKDVDREFWALSTSDVFLARIEKARVEITQGRSLSLEEMRQAVLP
jgi:antitoxin (DNA-binding transcriptional repressor) of toxin-antitoxin stability system